MRSAPSVLSIVTAVLLLAPATASVRAQQEQLEIDAFAINMSNIATGANARVDITINSWSTPEEREQLIMTMIEKGSGALLKALQKSSVKGRFRIPTARPPDPHHLSLGLDIRYAWQVPRPDGGKRIVLALDRYIGFAEARNQPRSIDYPFTVIEMHVNGDGDGQGTMSVATKVIADKDKQSITLENFGTTPVLLQAVKRQRESQ